MRNASGLTDYYLFYATNSLLGLKKMKEAMWKVDETGEFGFSDATDPNQMILFSKEPRYEVLSKLIMAHFGGREVTLADVEEFVLAETPFRENSLQATCPKEVGAGGKASAPGDQCFGHSKTGNISRCNDEATVRIALPDSVSSA